MAKINTNAQIVVLDARTLKYDGKTNGVKDGSRKESVVGTVLVLGEKPYPLRLFIDSGLTLVELQPHVAYHATVDLESRVDDKGQMTFKPTIKFIGEKAREFKLL